MGYISLAEFFTGHDPVIGSLRSGEAAVLSLSNSCCLVQRDAVDTRVTVTRILDYSDHGPCAVFALPPENDKSWPRLGIINTKGEVVIRTDENYLISDQEGQAKVCPNLLRRIGQVEVIEFHPSCHDDQKRFAFMVADPMSAQVYPNRESARGHISYSNFGERGCYVEALSEELIRKLLVVFKSGFIYPDEFRCSHVLVYVGSVNSEVIYFDGHRLHKLCVINQDASTALQEEQLFSFPIA